MWEQSNIFKNIVPILQLGLWAYEWHLLLFKMPRCKYFEFQYFKPLIFVQTFVNKDECVSFYNKQQVSALGVNNATL